MCMCAITKACNITHIINFMLWQHLSVKCVQQTCIIKCLGGYGESVRMGICNYNNVQWRAGELKGRHPTSLFSHNFTSSALTSFPTCVTCSKFLVMISHVVYGYCHQQNPQMALSFPFSTAEIWKYFALTYEKGEIETAIKCLKYATTNMYMCGA